MSPGSEASEVAVIGAGVVGLAVAYRLSKAGRRVTVIDKEPGPGKGVTSGQAGVIHVVQLPFGSLKSRLARKGNLMYDDLCRELGVRLNRMPALLVVRGWLRLPVVLVAYIYLRLGLRGEFRVQMMRGDGLRKIEPSLASGVSGGVVVHGYGTIDAESLVTRLKEKAENLGAIFRFGQELISAERRDGAFLLKTTNGEVETRAVVNAAGLYSDDVSEMLGRDLGRLEPGAGVMAVYSNLSLRSIITPLSLGTGGRTKGGAIIPATDGTTVIGPTLRTTVSKEDRRYTEEDLDGLRSKFHPLLNVEGTLLRMYTGVRPMSPTGDFIIDYDKAKRTVNLVGIESPGLTAAPAIAEIVCGILEEEA